MAVRIEAPYANSFKSAKSPKETFDYLADVETTVPENFKGVESFTEVEANTYRWEFEKIGYGNYELKIWILTRFETTPHSQIKVVGIPKPGACLFNADWTLKPQGKNTLVDFSAKFEIDAPVPGFLKSMALSLATKELGKLFDRYIERVEKNLK